MKNLENKINDNINLDILKRLNYIYRATISADKTLDYSKKINQLINLYKPQHIFNNVNDPLSEKTILLITYADNVNNRLVGETLRDFILFYNEHFSTYNLPPGYNEKINELHPITRGTWIYDLYRSN